MSIITVLREAISEDPVARVYYLFDGNEIVKTLEIDESGLLYRMSRTTTLAEPGTPGPGRLIRARKLMDGEAEQWALDEARRRGDWLGLPPQQLRALRVKFEEITPVSESSQQR